MKNMQVPQKLCYNCFAERTSFVGPCPLCGYDDRENAAKYPVALKGGSVLGGQYIVGRVLGQGGFGITYLAFDYQLKIKVAIKEYMPDGMATRLPDTTLVSVYVGEKQENFSYGAERFLDEARVLAKFNGNKNIAGVKSYFNENNTSYFVMDYIEGVSFKSYLQNNGGRTDYQDALRILTPVLRALAAVHREGFIHRDVTPDNIYITKDGEIKLLDFGSARYSLGDKSKSLDVILKAGYAPKEQYIRRGKQGPYTDVYSVAACFYASITGFLPPESLERLEDDNLIEFSARGIRIPSYLDAAIIKGLEVRAEDRFQSAEEFLAAIEAGQLGGAMETVQPVYAGAAVAPPVSQIPVYQQPVSQTPISQIPISQIPISQVPVSQTPSVSWQPAQAQTQQTQQQYPVPPQPVIASPEVRPPAKKNWLFAGIAAACVVLIASVIWIFSGSGKGDEYTPPPAEYTRSSSQSPAYSPKPSPSLTPAPASESAPAPVARDVEIRFATHSWDDFRYVFEQAVELAYPNVDIIMDDSIPHISDYEDELNIKVATGAEMDIVLVDYDVWYAYDADLCDLSDWYYISDAAGHFTSSYFNSSDGSVLAAPAAGNGYGVWRYSAHAELCAEILNAMCDPDSDLFLALIQLHSLINGKSYDGWLYFQRWDNSWLYKLEEGGDTLLLLSTQPRLYDFSFEDGYIFYRVYGMGEDDGIYKLLTDGSGLTRLCSDSAVYPVVYSGWVYYTNDSDGRTFYRVSADGLVNEQLLDANCEWIHLDEESGLIEFTSNSDNMTYDPATGSFSRD